MLTINVMDINDNAPLFETSVYELDIKEHVGLGSVLVSVRAVDADLAAPNNVVMYYLTGGYGKFAVNRYTGTLY